jgi:hypothetical protein
MPLGPKMGKNVSLLAELAADPEFWGTCPNCGTDIRLLDARLFSVTNELPEIIARAVPPKPNCCDRISPARIQLACDEVGNASEVD